MNFPVFISREVVDLVHRRSLEEHGGQDGLRDENALESALAQPLHAFHYARGDLFDLAAAYAYHLAENQPFIDGNKRTAVTVALLFLEGNGVSTTSIPDAMLYDAMIAIAKRQLNKTSLATLLRSELGK